MKKTVAGFELFVQLVIYYSLVTYFIELEFTASEHSLEAHPFFLWSERTVAAIFTVEYLIRWCFAKNRRLYPLTPMALIDFLAVAPFYSGFLVDMRSLRVIRTLRILRVFKVYRYNEALQSFVKSYRKVRQEMAVLGIAVLLLVFVTGTIVFESERHAQKEMFKTYSDGLWWSVVTLSTVGYGDKCPVTLTGRVATCVLLALGLGLFGSFISVIGGAFASTLIEKKQAQRRIALSPRAIERISKALQVPPEAISEEQAGQLVERALERYLGEPP